MSEKEGAAAFSESQWQELERQRNIYEYIMASLPVPPELLTPFPKHPSHTYHQDGIISLCVLHLSCYHPLCIGIGCLELMVSI